MGRQPEAIGQIQTAMIIGLAFIEALTIYALLSVLLLMGKLGVVNVYALDGGPFDRARPLTIPGLNLTTTDGRARWRL